MAVAGPVVPGSSIASRAPEATPTANAARPQPSVSRTWSLAARATSGGSASALRVEVKPARRSATVLISDAPVRVGPGEEVDDLGGLALVHHERAAELDDHLAALADAARPDADDPDVRARPGLPRLEDLGLGPQRVADVDRVGHRDVGPGEVRGRVLARVGDRQAGDEGQRERAVDERPPERRALGELVVEVVLVRVQRQAREPHVVGLGHRAPEAAAVDVADLQILVEPAVPCLRRLVRCGLHLTLLTVDRRASRGPNVYKSDIGRSQPAREERDAT